MKVILSRKGFDSTYGKIPSPILLDGTLLSMPIPSEDELSFTELCHGEHTYSEILKQLASQRQYEKYDKCHLDPDIRENVRLNPVPGWKSAFGQVAAAQTYLSNRSVNQGDLFLFFGRFKQTAGSLSDGTLHFVKKAPILHIIYGYMEVGEILPREHIKARNIYWHPHSNAERYTNTNNTIYLASDMLSINREIRGWGVFDYSDRRVLTLADKTATWREIPCLMPDAVEKNVKNDAKGSGLYYQGVWQELVLKKSPVADAWVNEILGLC